MPTPSNQNPFPNDQTQNAADLLGRVHVAAPCSASWEAMSGGERVRSCEKCAHKVYNLSAMTAGDAAQLVARAEGINPERVCVRFYRRSDGTMLTQDCPVGVRALRQKAARRVSAAFASVGVVFGMNMANQTRDEQPRLVQMILNALDPPAPIPVSNNRPQNTPPPLTGIVALPMARDIPPPPPAPEPLMGEAAFTVPSTSAGNVKPGVAVAGELSLSPSSGSSFEGGPEPAPPAPDKSFLKGSGGKNDAWINAPASNARPDPFASHRFIMGRIRATPTHHKEKPRS